MPRLLKVDECHGAGDAFLLSHTQSSGIKNEDACRRYSFPSSHLSDDDENKGVQNACARLLRGARCYTRCVDFFGVLNAARLQLAAARCCASLLSPIQIVTWIVCSILTSIKTLASSTTADICQRTKRFNRGGKKSDDGKKSHQKSVKVIFCR